MEKKDLTKTELNNLDKDTLIDIILSKQDELSEINAKVDFLMDQVKLSRQQLYGTSSEKNITEEQLCMFNEAEGFYDDDIKEPELEKITYTRKKRKGKRDEDLSGLPVRVEEHTLTEEELEETFPEGYERFPDEVYRKLDYKPAIFEVIEHHIAVYRGKNGNILRADHPVELLDNSIVTPSLCAGIMNAKYVNAMPLYRIEQEFTRRDISLSRQVMAGWMIKAAERYLSLIHEKMKHELFMHHVIHADETPVKVNKDGRKAGSKSYMWVYRSSEKDKNPVIIYDYRKTRHSENLEEFLEDFSGCIVSDGYAAYHKVAAKWPERITVSGCWVHARRKFADIIKSASGSDKKKPKYSLASYAVEQIADIYHLDNALEGNTAEERLKERKTTIAPRVEAFFEWIKSHEEEVAKGSNIGKAFTYALNQEEYLKAFLYDPQIPLDNNPVERAIRPFCIGKKNWVMIDTVHGAESSAIIYSIAETAKANHLKPYEYFKYLLEEIPRHMEDTELGFLDDLLPWSDSLPEECHNKP